MKLKKTVTAIQFVPELDGKGEHKIDHIYNGEFTVNQNLKIRNDFYGLNRLGAESIDRAFNGLKFRRVEVPVEVEYEAEPPVFEGYEWVRYGRPKTGDYFLSSKGKPEVSDHDWVTEDSYDPAKQAWQRHIYRPVPKPFMVGDWVACITKAPKHSSRPVIGKIYKVEDVGIDLLGVMGEGQYCALGKDEARHATPAEIAEATKPKPKQIDGYEYLRDDNVIYEGESRLLPSGNFTDYDPHSYSVTRPNGGIGFETIRPVYRATKPKRDWVKIFEEAADYFWRCSHEDYICNYLKRQGISDAEVNRFQYAFDPKNGFSSIYGAWWDTDTNGMFERAKFCRQIAALGNAEIERRMNGTIDLTKPEVKNG